MTIMKGNITFSACPNENPIWYATLSVLIMLACVNNKQAVNVNRIATVIFFIVTFVSPKV
jgi:hypothetical protein